MKMRVQVKKIIGNWSGRMNDLARNLPQEQVRFQRKLTLLTILNLMIIVNCSYRIKQAPCTHLTIVMKNFTKSTASTFTVSLPTNQEGSPLISFHIPLTMSLPTYQQGLTFYVNFFQASLFWARFLDSSLSKSCFILSMYINVSSSSKFHNYVSLSF